MIFKQNVYHFLLLSSASVALAACSVNPATGQKQFTALMPAAQESQIGATEHQKIEQQYGFYNNPRLSAYVSDIGNRVTRDTERPDVQYKFFILDSPIVNAFALPGGYIYVSRGLLALANSEAELGAVLAHETGHITARHSAARYSQGVLTNIGAAVISAATKSADVSRALGLGSNLYLSSYSRGQEREADSLGLRYMTRGGYDPAGMPAFLASMQVQSALENRLEGKDGADVNYFSSHPPTGERVSETGTESRQYPQGGTIGRDQYLSMIDGLTYGDSAAQGFARGNRFYHPGIGFTFEVPQGFKIRNMSDKIAATSSSGAVILFDIAQNSAGLDPAAYIAQDWMKNESLGDLENININGMNAATASFAGSVNGEPMNIRLVSVRWKDNAVARFQIAIPHGAGSGLLNALKQSTYSFNALSPSDLENIRPQGISVIMVKNGDSVQSFAAKLPFDDFREERFRALNALGPNEAIQIGRRYKIISD